MFLTVSPVRDQLLQVVRQSLASYIDAPHSAEQHSAVEHWGYMRGRKAAVNDQAAQGSISREVRLLGGKAPQRQLCAWEGQVAWEPELFEYYLRDGCKL